MNKILIFILLTIASWTAQAEETIDHMVEFCTAVLIVAQDVEEYRLWKETYEIDAAQVLYFQNVLQIQLDTNKIRGAEVLEAAAQCKVARLESED